MLRAIFASSLLMLTATSAGASVLISAAPTSNMSCAASVCMPTAKKAVLNATDLANMLASGDVTVETGAGAVTITVTQSFSWASANTLILDAQENVSFQAPVVVAGPGGLKISYGGGGAGDLLFFNGASVTFFDLSSSLFVQGESYKLEPSLDQLAADLGHGAGDFALANDIDLTGHLYTSAPIAVANGLTLEAMGHSIAGLEVHGGHDCLGLFGDLVSSDVRDLRLTGVDISGGSKGAQGAIAGCTSGATIVNDSASGTVKGGEGGWTGGMIGQMAGLVRNATAAVDVAIRGTKHIGFAGGLVGYGPQATIQHSSASGTVTGDAKQTVGGLVGYGGIITNSFATGNVSVASGLNGRAGGLVGLLLGGGGIDQSFATGAVSGGDQTDAGGLAGKGLNIVDSYATGAVACGADCHAGGLVGVGEKSQTSYSTGAVSGGAGSFVGGFIGRDESRGTLDKDYWDLDTSGISDPSGGAGNKKNDRGLTGLGDAALKSALPSGFEPTTWNEKGSINGGYPYLIANPPQ